MKSITMMVLGEGIEKRTIIRALDNSSLAVVALNEKQTLETFSKVLKEYGYKIVKDGF